MTVQLCLVSAQATPNITPLIDLRTKPEEVIMLVSSTMEHRADWLEHVIKPRGIKIRRWSVDAPYDIERIRDQLIERILNYSGQDKLMLNATGGTKPMSIAAYEVFRELELPIFYIHPEKDRLIWMFPKGLESINLANRLKLEDFLEVHGASVSARIERNRISQDRQVLIERLVGEIDRFPKNLSTLNWFAAGAAKTLRSHELTQNGYLNHDMELLVDEFSTAGLFELKHDRLYFPSEEARFFVNGGWLEHYVYETAADLRKSGDLQDLGRSIEVQRRQGDKTVPNEIDVAALVENRLHIIECKTRKWQGERNQNGPGAEALYRLDTLKDLLGGLNARAMLVSYRPLRKHDLERSAALGIKACSGRQLQHLSGELKNWFWG